MKPPLEKYFGEYFKQMDTEIGGSTSYRLQRKIKLVYYIYILKFSHLKNLNFSAAMFFSHVDTWDPT